MSRRLVAALLMPLLACGQHIHVRHRDGAGPDIRLDTASAATVGVTEADFTPVFRTLGKQAPIWNRPLETARQLFKVPERSGTYLYEVRTQRLVPMAADNPMVGEPSEQEFVREYLQWCRGNVGPGDCLRLLEKDGIFSSHSRYATALAIGWQSALGEMRASLRDMVTPDAVMGTIIGAMTVYLMLWILPEPFSKGMAAAMTIWLIGYFGFDPLWQLAKAWRSLVEEADRALDFVALRRAGERFGQRVGPGAARLLILVTTVAIGGTSGMAGKGPSLPRFSLANAQAERQLGVTLVTATTAESVLVGTEAVTITFAPGLLAMGAASPKGSTTESLAKPGPRLGPKVRTQMGPRGWTPEKIAEALKSGEQFPAVNKATGHPAIRYVHPDTGQSVVVDTVTNEVIHVGGPGFKYGPGSGDLG